MTLFTNGSYTVCFIVVIVFVYCFFVVCCFFVFVCCFLFLFVFCSVFVVFFGLFILIITPNLYNSRECIFFKLPMIMVDM